MTPDELLKRVTEAADVVREAEASTQFADCVSTEDWSGLQYAARILDDLERDIRSDVLADRSLH